MGDQPAPTIRVHAESTADTVRILVSDNGMGIEPEYHDRVFQLFERLDPTTAGTGAGLAIVKRIVEDHGGRIEVRSKGTGDGCTFEIELPRPPEG